MANRSNQSDLDFTEDLGGWIQLQRSILNEPWAVEKPWSKRDVFTELLKLTTFKDKRTIEPFGKRMTIYRGQAFVVKRALAERAGWNRPKLDRFFKLLGKNQNERYALIQEPVKIGSSNPVENSGAIGTLITFVNFDRLCPKEGLL